MNKQVASNSCVYSSRNKGNIALCENVKIVMVYKGYTGEEN